jgi:hypothetical protein
MQHIRAPLPSSSFFLIWFIRWSFTGYTSLLYSTRSHAIMCAPISSYLSVIHSFILRCTCLTNLLPDRSLLVFLTTLYYFHFRLQWTHSVVESSFQNNVKRRRFRINFANSTLNSMRTHSLFKDTWRLYQLGWGTYGLGLIPQPFSTTLRSKHPPSKKVKWPKSEDDVRIPRPEDLYFWVSHSRLSAEWSLRAGSRH